MLLCASLTYPIRGKAGAKDIDKSIRLVNILIFRTPRGAIGSKIYSCVTYPHQYPQAPVLAHYENFVFD